MQMNKPATILGLDFSSSDLKVVGIKTRKGKVQGPVFMREIAFTFDDIGSLDKEKPLMTMVKAFKETLGAKKPGLIISLPSYMVSYHQLPSKVATKTQAVKILEEKWETISPLPRSSMDYSLNLWGKNHDNKCFVGLMENELAKKIRSLAQKTGLQLVGLAPQMGLLAKVWPYLSKIKEKDICAYVTKQGIEWCFFKDDQTKDLGYCAKQANETPLSHTSRVLKIIAYRNAISPKARLVLAGPLAESYAEHFSEESFDNQKGHQAYLKVVLLKAEDLLMPNMEWDMWPIYAYMLFQGNKSPLLHFPAPFVGKIWLDSPKTSQRLFKVFGLLAVLLVAQAIYGIYGPSQRVSDELSILRSKINKVRLERKSLEDRLLQQAGYDWKSDPGKKLSQLLQVLAESLPDAAWVQKIEYSPNKAKVFFKGEMLDEVSGNLEGRDGISLAGPDNTDQAISANSLTLELDLTDYEPGRDQATAENQGQDVDNVDDAGKEPLLENADQIQEGEDNLKSLPQDIGQEAEQASSSKSLAP